MDLCWQSNVSAFYMLSRLVIAFLPRSNYFLISWLQLPSAVILEPKKIKSHTVSIVPPSICHEVMVPDDMILVFWMLSFKPTFSLAYLKICIKLKCMITASKKYTGYKWSCIYMSYNLKEFIKWFFVKIYIYIIFLYKIINFVTHINTKRILSQYTVNKKTERKMT